MLLSVCVSQAGELLQELEKNVQKSIKNNYGKENQLTSVWNNTMKEVLYPFIYLRERFVIYLFDQTFKTNVLNYFTFYTLIKLVVVILFCCYGN